ncbi:MAG TPA: PLP-dependent aminotransferase family protein [Bryobacteraceae bacterium]|nr:PLP-dependent aminotransferase family protein [Bryobacteraceae bacterium]
MQFRPELDSSSDTPIYRQLGQYVQRLIGNGELHAGDRLPPTRELAGQLGLNRTTVSAAYEWLESEGLIEGAVGRGSFVRGSATARPVAIDWNRMLTPSIFASAGSASSNAIDFTSSRPSEDLFPIDEFRACADEVLSDPQLQSLLQLGSPLGYGPLRSWLLERARQHGVAGPDDDILITNGCQQAVDILRRALTRPGTKVAVEDPVYPGLRNLFLDADADLTGIPVTGDGMDLTSLRRALDAGVRIVVVTPSFQNPTGATIPAAARSAFISMTRSAGAVVIENDIYSDLVYRQEGERPPRLKSLDPNVILLGSFSKIAFPGVRVGWVIAPKPVIARAAELKQLTDLHTDQLSQAFLLRFAESGRLARHEARAIVAGREKLRAVEQACQKHLAGCRWLLPGGGMNMWIDLPAGLDAGALRGLARQAGVDYLPGRYFSVSRPLDHGLRLSFAGLDPARIRRGIEILGGVVDQAMSSRDEASRPTLAVV